MLICIFIIIPRKWWLHWKITAIVSRLWGLISMTRWNPRPNPSLKTSPRRRRPPGESDYNVSSGKYWVLLTESWRPSKRPSGRWRLRKWRSGGSWWGRTRRSSSPSRPWLPSRRRATPGSSLSQILLYNISTNLTILLWSTWQQQTNVNSDSFKRY